MRYSVHLFDASGTLLSVLEPISPQYRRRANQATGFSFGVLADDERLDDLQAARDCILYRDGIEKAAGYITARDLTSNPYRIECITNEALLRRNIAPRSWSFWDNMDLADAVRDLLLGFKTAAKNTGEDWLNAVESENVDVLTWPGRVVLAKDTNLAYLPHGFITVQFDMGDIVRLDRLRWAEEVGEEVRIKVQFRSSTDGTTWGAWTSELSSVTPADYGVALMGSDRYLQVKLHLYTDDTTTLDRNNVPTGFTPMLMGVEAVARTGGVVTEGNIIESTGVTLKGYTFSRENALRILSNWCTDHGYEFRVDGQKRLHFAKTLGQTTSIVLRSTDNMDIQRLNDNADAMENVVLCLGAGDGPAQLQTVLRDEDSIATYGVELPGVFEDSDCETLADLTAKGQAYLQKSAWPVEEFAVYRVPVWELEDFGLYDTVTVVDPRRGTVTTARILDEERKYGKSEEVTLGLNTTLDNIVERIVKKQIPKPQKAKSSPGIPWGVSLTPGIRSLRLRWSGQAEYYLIEHSTNGTTWSILEPYWQGYSYTHPGINLGEVHYYRISGVLGGQVSEPTEPVSGESGGVPLPDVDPPEAPSGLALSTDLEYVGQITWSYVLATWVSDSSAAHTLVRYRQDGQGDDQWQYVMATGTKAKLSPLVGNSTYEVQARAVDGVGNASDWCVVKTLITAKDITAPTISAGVLVMPVKDGISVSLLPQNNAGHPDYASDWSRALDWDGVEVYVGDSQTFTPSDSNLVEGGKLQNVYLADVDPETVYWIKARVYDTSKNYSEYTEAASVTTGRLKLEDLEEYNNPTAPNQPSNVVDVRVFRGWVVYWDGHMSGPDVELYIVEYATSEDGEIWSDWIVCGTEVRSTHFTHQGLDPDLYYKYRVKAVSISGVSSVWTEKVAGQPGKVSLAEDITGALAGDYLADGAVSADHLDAGLAASASSWDSTATTVSTNSETWSQAATDAGSALSWQSEFTHSPEEIETVVSEVFPLGDTSQTSRISQQADQITQTVARLDYTSMVIGTATSVGGSTLTDTTKDFTALVVGEVPLDITGMSLRVEVTKDTKTYGIIRTIVSYTADTITVDAPWITGYVPVVGDIYQIGLMSVVSGTHIDQTNEAIRLIAMDAKDGADLAAAFSAVAITPSEISTAVTELYPDGISNDSVLVQHAADISARIMKNRLVEGVMVSDVVAEINASPEGVKIAGKKITLDGDTVADGDFKVSGDAVFEGSFKAKGLGFLSLGRKASDEIGLKFWGNDDTGEYIFRAPESLGEFPDISVSTNSAQVHDEMEVDFYVPKGCIAMSFAVGYYGGGGADLLYGTEGWARILVENEVKFHSTWSWYWNDDMGQFVGIQPSDADLSLNIPPEWGGTWKTMKFEVSATSSPGNDAITGLTIRDVSVQFKLRMMGYESDFGLDAEEEEEPEE